MTGIELAQVAQKMSDAFDLYSEAEDNLLAALLKQTAKKFELEEAQNDLLLSDRIDGKNSEVRTAQLATYTKLQRMDLHNASLEVMRARTAHSKASEELSVMKVLVRLQAKEDE